MAPSGRFYIRGITTHNRYLYIIISVIARKMADHMRNSYNTGTLRRGLYDSMMKGIEGKHWHRKMSKK